MKYSLCQLLSRTNVEWALLWTGLGAIVTGNTSLGFGTLSTDAHRVVGGSEVSKRETALMWNVMAFELPRIPR